MNPQQTQQMPAVFLGGVQIENFLHRFGSEVYKRGFQLTERLAPSGLPLVQNQVISRFRSNDPQLTTVLYQVGLGIFSANATPPYRSWDDFAPRVEDGIAVLLQVRDSEEQATAFKPVTLRYINAFGPELTGGREAGAFLAEVLKIQLNLPEVITEDTSPGASVSPFIRVTVPKANGVLHVNAGGGVANGVPAIIFDTTFSSTDATAPTTSALMGALHSAHQLLHDMFMQLTEPIRELMQPEQ
jgi:uncharacterized protein (TIGR04255 family)